MERDELGDALLFAVARTLPPPPSFAVVVGVCCVVAVVLVEWVGHSAVVELTAVGELICAMCALL